MEFTSRWLEEGDYDNILKGWWERWRWPIVPRNFLPDNGTGGIMISKDGIDICAMFLYFANSDLCFLGFSISNPEYKENDRLKAIEKLIEISCEYAFEKGYEYIYSVANKKTLIDGHKKNGFNPSLSNCVEMIKFKHQK